jgi:hypothetical protein
MSNFNIRSVVKEFLREKVEVEELPEQMLRLIKRKRK